MHETLIRHPKLRVERRTGTEGPRHDPYAFEEWHVTTEHNEIVLHMGLAFWMKVNGKDRAEFCGHRKGEETERWLVDEQFPYWTGFTLKQIVRMAERINSRCRRCGGRDMVEVSGYPGETLKVCCHCDLITGSSFDESAII